MANSFEMVVLVGSGKGGKTRVVRKSLIRDCRQCPFHQIEEKETQQNLLKVNIFCSQNARMLVVENMSLMQPVEVPDDCPCLCFDK